MANPVDPVTVSVVQHRLHAIVEEMGEAMLRTSYSQILNSSRDFSTAICDLGGRLIAQAEHVPIHVGALPWAAKSVTEFFGDDIHPGDVFLLNDPYHGGNHLPDLTAFVPVFEGDRPVFWSINRAHQSDIGGSTHGAYNAAATEIWQEGIRVTPLRLYDRGVVRRDVLEMLVTNVRHPHDFRGDLAAMIGSAHVGQRRMLALAGEFGWDITHAAIEAVLDGAERQARAVIATWKDGVYRGEAFLDDDGHRLYRHPYPRDGHQARQRPDHRSVGFARAGGGLRQLVVSEHAIRGGGGAGLPDRSAHAEERRRVPPAGGDRQTGHGGVGERGRARDAVHQSLLAGDHPGDHHGAGPGLSGSRDGRLGAAVPHCHPGTRSAHAETVHLAHVPGATGWRCVARRGRMAGGRRVAGGRRHQVRQPGGDGGAVSAVLPQHEFRPGSGGDGQFRGGPGCVLEMVAEIDEPARGNTAGDGVKYGACGILGGKDGLPHRYVLHSEGRQQRVLKTKEVGIEIRPGDVFRIESGGGGGWGDPAKRDPAARERDEINGFV